jgi:hypothetical protein
LKLIYNEKQQSDITPRADFTTGESIPAFSNPDAYATCQPVP